MVLPGQTSPRPATTGDTTIGLPAWTSRYTRLHVDLGTGDGRFAVHLARQQPDLGVIGIDTCLDHLHGPARRLPANLRFVQRDARDAWIGEGLATTSVSVNFPYGSLLRELVDADPALLERLDQLLGRHGQLRIRVNERALLGTELDPRGAEHAIVRGLQRLDQLSVSSRPLGQAELRAFPSTWSKRLGYGRPTVAFLIEAARRPR
jgi:16S rRNA (adenine(1408)-N(1))-methyltransferase